MVRRHLTTPLGLSRLRIRLADEVIDREDAGPARHQVNQGRYPREMRGPGNRIDKNLNDKRHDQKRRRAQPCSESNNNQG